MGQVQRWSAPAAGVLFVALFVLTLVFMGLGGGGPGPDSADEIVQYYRQHGAQLKIAALLLGLGAVSFLFFVGGLWRVLRAADDVTGWLAAVALSGGVVATVGMLMFASVAAILSDFAKHLDPTTAHAMYLFNVGTSPSPMSGGIAALLLATGLATIGARPLPRWLGWAALPLALLSLSPAGFVGVLASLPWVVGVSVSLALHSPKPSAGPAA